LDSMNQGNPRTTSHPGASVMSNCSFSRWRPSRRGNSSVSRVTIPLLYNTGFPSMALSGKGSLFNLVSTLYLLQNYRLMKFPMHPESIKALAGVLPIDTQILRLSALRALLTAILCSPGRSVQGLSSGGSPSFPHSAVGCSFSGHSSDRSDLIVHPIPVWFAILILHYEEVVISQQRVFLHSLPESTVLVLRRGIR
jgi:hypothetical protein